MMELGKLIIGIGLFVVFVGILVYIGVPLGRLPGDIVIDKGVKMYIPITTSIIISFLLTVLFWLWRMFQS
jgi:hypothetical protein